MDLLTRSARQTRRGALTQRQRFEAFRKELGTIWPRLHVLVGWIFFMGVAQPVARQRPPMALRIVDALSSAAGLTVRGTITNNFLSASDASCADSSFALLAGNGRYQGVVKCVDAAISPGAKTHFEVTFPPVTLGVYYLRYQKTTAPPQYEVVPLRLRLKVGS